MKGTVSKFLLLTLMAGTAIGMNSTSGNISDPVDLNMMPAGMAPAMQTHKTPEEEAAEAELALKLAKDKALEMTSQVGQIVVVGAVAESRPVQSVKNSIIHAMKSVWNYLSNSRVASYASSAGNAAASAVAAPFDYTIGLAAQKSGLSNAVANSAVVQNNPYYLGSAGSCAYSTARYALGLAGLYAAYKIYNYATTPASQKLDGSQAEPKKKKLSAKALKKKEELFSALDAFAKKIDEEVAKNNSDLLNSVELKALKNFKILQKNTLAGHDEKSLKLVPSTDPRENCFNVMCMMAVAIDECAKQNKTQEKQKIAFQLKGLIDLIKSTYDAYKQEVRERKKAKKEIANKSHVVPVAQQANQTVQQSSAPVAQPAANRTVPQQQPKVALQSAQRMQKVSQSGSPVIAKPISSTAREQLKLLYKTFEALIAKARTYKQTLCNSQEMLSLEGLKFSQFNATYELATKFDAALTSGNLQEAQKKADELRRMANEIVIQRLIIMNRK